MPAVKRNLVGRRPGQQAARGTGMTRTDGLIVGVEQEAERRIERPIIRHMWHKHELLEKPGHMRSMPFYWAGIRHRLDALILLREICGQCLCRRAHFTKPDGQDHRRVKNRDIAQYRPFVSSRDASTQAVILRCVRGTISGYSERGLIGSGVAI